MVTRPVEIAKDPDIFHNNQILVPGSLLWYFLTLNKIQPKSTNGNLYFDTFFKMAAVKYTECIIVDQNIISRTARVMILVSTPIFRILGTKQNQ